MLKTIEIDLTYQPTIDRPPEQAGNLFEKAASNDKTTVNAWREIWVDLTAKAKERFGSFAERSIGKLYGINERKPCIVIGSGPSLKSSIEALKENAKLERPVMTVSCLHNFGYFEDEGFHADYYLTLDSGEIVIQDVFEGRKEKPEYYWEKTKGKKLLATVATPPKLFDLWQGEIFLFNVPIPDFDVQTKLQAIEKFTHYIAPGGNALGGCMYIAKAVFSSDPIIYVGADFCFDYNNQFHSYKTHYDNIGQYIVWPDVFGIPRKTWRSYLNFKYWFDHIAINVPGNYISCSEGLLGSYPGGNIKQFQYMPLRQALVPYWMSERIYFMQHDAATGALVGKEEIKLKDYFSNAQFDKDLTLF